MEEIRLEGFSIGRGSTSGGSDGRSSRVSRQSVGWGEEEEGQRVF